MVPADSTVMKIADVDRPGIRIAVVRNHASTNELLRQVKQAEFIYAETLAKTFALYRRLVSSRRSAISARLNRRPSAAFHGVIAAAYREYGLTTTVFVETARAYAARVGVLLVIAEYATPPENRYRKPFAHHRR